MQRASTSRSDDQPPEELNLLFWSGNCGWPVGFEDFMTGFLIENGAAHIGRLAGVAQTPYGSLLVSDDANGVIYRISWAGR